MGKCARARNSLRRACARVRELCMRVCVCRVQNLTRKVANSYCSIVSRVFWPYLFCDRYDAFFVKDARAHARKLRYDVYNVHFAKWDKFMIDAESIIYYMRLESAFSLPVPA
jgi:hypothetical protein